MLLTDEYQGFTMNIRVRISSGSPSSTGSILLIALALIGFDGARARALIGHSNEVWVSANVTGSVAGSGTLADPYTGPNWDSIMESFLSVEGLTIHLLPGTHYTAGVYYDDQPYRLQKNQKLIGAGVDVTIIKRT